MRKAISDALAIARLDTLRFSRPLYAFLGGMLFLPLPMLFFAHFLVPNSDEVGPRLLAGSIVFGIGLRAVAGLGTQLTNDRFTYRLKLIKGCPVHPFSYAAGMMLAGTGRGLLNACMVLLLAPVFGIHVVLSLWFLPVVTLASLSLTGVALIIGTWAPSWESGSFGSNTAGTFITLMSPVYYPLSRLPDWLQPLARLSPYTYAAQALDAILSGRGGFLDEIGVLVALTVAGLALGLFGMRWRET